MCIPFSVENVCRGWLFKWIASMYWNSFYSIYVIHESAGIYWRTGFLTQCTVVLTNIPHFYSLLSTRSIRRMYFRHVAKMLRSISLHSITTKDITYERWIVPSLALWLRLGGVYHCTYCKGILSFFIEGSLAALYLYKRENGRERVPEENLCPEE